MGVSHPEADRVALTYPIGTSYPPGGRIVNMVATEPEFYFDGMAIGYFVGGDGPRSAGSYRYEPYRGPGHYEMQTLLRAGVRPRCSYNAVGERVEFSVVGCPEYGVLDLCDFKSDPHEPG